MSVPELEYDEKEFLQAIGGGSLEKIIQEFDKKADYVFFVEFGRDRTWVSSKKITNGAEKFNILCSLTREQIESLEKSWM